MTDTHQNGKTLTTESTGLSTDKYPRVLLVNGEPFHPNTAGGLTLCRLFEGWPRERLGCLFLSRIEPDWAFCSRYWKLDLTDLRCVSRLLGERSSKEASANKVVRPGTGIPSGLKLSVNGDSAFCSFKKWCRQRAIEQGVIELSAYRIPVRVLKEIDAFRPQLVYSWLGFNRLQRLVIDITDRYSIPVVPHFMDDWPTTFCCSSILRPVLRRAMHRDLRTILERSPVPMVIGDAMAQEYTRRYGGEFLPFMNAVAPELLKRPTVPPKHRRKVRLTYVGGLHLNRWRSLLDIAWALKELHKDGLEVEALVYTQPHYGIEAKKLCVPPVMRFAGSLTPAEIPDALRDADILIHVESFDRANSVYTRHSVSTKIPECMAAARPILAYGPEELASIRYVRDAGAGVTVGRRNPAELTESLRRLVESADVRQQLGMLGFKVASQRHNSARQHEEFRSLLAAASGENTLG